MFTATSRPIPALSRRSGMVFILAGLWLGTAPVGAQVSASGWTPPPPARSEAQRPQPGPRELAARGAAPLSRVRAEIRLEAVPLRRLPPLTEKERGVTEETDGARRRLRVGAARTLTPPLGETSEAAGYGAPEGQLLLARVASPGALRLRLRLAEVDLPEGARLFIYSRSRPDEFAGPYTGRGPGGDGTFWTPPLAGGEVVVEYFAPTAALPAAGRLPFSVTEVSHIFQDAEAVAGRSIAATPCNLDVPEEWREAAKSVALLQFQAKGGEFACTGTLLNTTNNSGEPYVLTANHCLSQQSEARTLWVRWFYDSATSVPATGLYSRAVVVATGLASDFTLLNLREPVPSGVRFAGWTTERPAISAPVTAIHHPRSSYKRIAFGAAVAPGACGPGVPPEVCDGRQWVRWERGITEPGSSGSGLFLGGASDPKLAGTLTGGSSSCDNPSGSDYYGRFDLTFQAVGYYLTGAGCAYVPDEVRKAIGADGGALSVRLDVASDGSACPWAAESRASWLRVTSAPAGSGAATVNFSAEANTSPEPRTGYLVVAGQLIAVTQAGVSNCPGSGSVRSGLTYSRELTASDCRSSLVAGAYAERFTLAGQAGQQLEIVMQPDGFSPHLTLFGPGGAVLAASDRGVISGASFYGGGSYYTLPTTGTYVVEASSNFPEMTGSYRLTLHKRCHCTLTPERQEFGAAGGGGEFTLSAPPDCAWRVGAKPDWVMLGGAASGVGGARFNYTVAPTPAGQTNVQRAGDLKFELDIQLHPLYLPVFTVAQSAPCSYVFASESEGPQDNLGLTSGQFSLSTGSYCPWTLQASGSWLKLTGVPPGGSGYGWKPFSYDIETANLAPAPRVATVSAGGAEFRIVQPGIGSACSITPISVGQTISATMQAGCLPPGRLHRPGMRGAYYSFAGTAGQRVAVAASSGAMNLRAWLVAPDGKWIGRGPSDMFIHTGTTRIPYAGYVTLPATGEYRVAIQGFEELDAPLRYTLSLTGGDAADCKFALGAPGATVGAAGGQGSVSVTQTGGASCAWTATSDSDWLTVAAGAGGVNYTVAPNPGGSRFGFLTLAGQHFRVTQPQSAAPGVVSAASYVERVSGGSIVSLFGINLADGTEAATSLPLPLSLAGTSVRLTTRSQGTVNYGGGVTEVYEGTNRSPAQLFYVSPTQINFLMPNSVGDGVMMTVEVVRRDGHLTVAEISVSRFAPALFAANADGRGVAAAYIQRVRADGSQAVEEIVETGAGGRWAAKAIDLGPPTEQVYLILFGTGLRNIAFTSDPVVTADAGGVPLEITYAGPQGQYAGLDQVNVRLPRSLVGKGEVPVTIRVNGVASNAVTVKLADAR
jgi:lysyl endopeptidase